MLMSILMQVILQKKESLQKKFRRSRQFTCLFEVMKSRGEMTISHVHNVFNIGTKNNSTCDRRQFYKLVYHSLRVFSIFLAVCHKITAVHVRPK